MLIFENYTSKTLYVMLISTKHSSVNGFINEIIQNNEHNFWGACRDMAREVLINGPNNWQWLGYRVDDFGMIVEENMRKKLPKWHFRALMGVGGLSKNIDDVGKTVSWLMDRYINEMKNLFDNRYRNYIDISTVMIVDFEEDKCCNTYQFS